MKKIYPMCLLLAMVIPVYPAEPALSSVDSSEMSSTNSQADIPTGPNVFGVFWGRTPCHGIAREMNLTVSDECIKRKWKVVFYQDPVTHAPTTYSLFGSGYRAVPRTGKWAMVKGSGTDPAATVYQLDKDFLSFLKLDDNVLLFLGQDGKPLVGNIYFSYALNRATKK